MTDRRLSYPRAPSSPAAVISSSVPLIAQHMPSAKSFRRVVVKLRAVLCWYAGFGGFRLSEGVNISKPII